MTDFKKKNPNGEAKGLRKWTGKKWFYPAVYLCLAAVIMSGVLWYQMDGGSTNQANTKNNDHPVAFQKGGKDAQPVNGSQEVIQWPIGNKDSVDVTQPFYDVKGTTEEQTAALVNYDHSYSQNTGINLQAKDKKAFDVRAAMSGKVVKAKKDALLGYVVELQHKDGVTTVYQSLASTDVKKGQAVAQGDLLGKAGTNVYNKDAGVHLHFEIRKDSMPVDPVAYFTKDLSSLDKIKANTNATSDVVADDSAKNDATKNDSTKNNPSDTENAKQHDAMSPAADKK